MIFSRRDVKQVTNKIDRLPSYARVHVKKAQDRNAAEAQAYLNALVPKDTGSTKRQTGSLVLDSASGSVDFLMFTGRVPNPGEGREEREGDKIRAILFANDTDFFYSTWRLNKKRWKRRISGAMNKAAKEAFGV